MNSSLLLSMDKSLARAAFEEKKPKAGVDYFERYLRLLQDQIEQNSDNQKYVEEKQNTIVEYKEFLLKSAKEAYYQRDWFLCAYLCRFLVKYETTDSAVYKHAALCYRNVKQFDTALELMQMYSQKEPEDDSRLVYLAEILFEVNREENAYKAIDYFKQFLAIHPDDSQVYNSLGNIYASVINAETANANEEIYYFKKALEYNPNFKQALRNVHFSYLKTGDRETANKYYDKFVKYHKDNFNHDDYFDYAAHLISNGDFIEGWRYIDHRFEKETSPTFFPKIDAKKWNGLSNINKETLLVHAEQGFGDVIMYIRFVECIKKYAKKVIVVLQPELIDLFRESNLGVELYSRYIELDRLNFDTYIPLISIPRIYKLTPQNVPFKEGYLNVNRRRIEDFKKKYVKNDKFRIGVCFEGAVGSKKERRDIDWKYLKILSDIENVQLYCFKKDLSASDFKNIDPSIDIVCFGESLSSFADTAAAIKSMDLMISTDNVILNLSGSLGAKTFGIFNRLREYRWYGTEQGKNVWYESVTPFQAEKFNEWEEVLFRIKAEIENLVRP